jgi:hypothetical protein
MSVLNVLNLLVAVVFEDTPQLRVARSLLAPVLPAHGS